MFSLPNNIWDRNSRRAISVLSHSLSQDVVFDRNLHLSWLCTIDYCSVGEAICVRAIIRSRERERKWKWAHTDQPQRWFAYSWDRRTLNVLSLWCRFRELADPPFSLPQSLSARREINFDAVGADVSSLSFSVASCFIICAWFSVSQDFVPSPIVLQTPSWRDGARNSGSWSQNPQKMKERFTLVFGKRNPGTSNEKQDRIFQFHYPVIFSWGLCTRFSPQFTVSRLWRVATILAH